MSQFAITQRHLRWARYATAGLVLATLLFAAALSGFWYRLSSYENLLEENYSLRGRLATIDRKMEQVDDAIRRIRLYDSQIRRLSKEVPNMGPLDEEEMAEWEHLLAYESQDESEGDGNLLVDPNGIPMDEHPADGVSPGDIRPAELWAQAVEARAARLVGLIDEVEPRMSTLVQDLEDWRSTKASYPSMWPLEGVLTSGFGYRRSPFSHRWKFHAGIDISAPRGTPIVTPAPGVVTFSGYNEGYGRMVEIDHGHGVTSRFAHNTTHFVKEGDVVERGQRIATVGSTGRTTGPHLHYELHMDGQAVDPLDYLP